MVVRFTFLALCAAPFLVGAQGLLDGFFKGKGNTTLAFSGAYEKAETYWIGQGNELPIARKMPVVGLFATHGLREGFDIVMSAPFVDLKPQDASLFLKARVFKREDSTGNFMIALAGGMSTPMSKYETESAFSIGQRATILEPRLIIQYQFAFGFFIQAQTGYTYAFSPTPSGIPASVKMGLAGSKWYGDIWFDFRHAIGGKDYRGEGALRPNSFRELGVSYQRVGGSVYRSFSPKFGLSLGVSQVLSGRNTFKSTVVYAAWVWHPGWFVKG